MDLIVNPGILSGAISVPSSKSQTLRAVLFASLASGTSIISDYLSSPDTDAMIQACQHLGAKIKVTPHQLIIHGVAGYIKGAQGVIDAGNSGIVLRFISAIAGLGSTPITITGDQSIQERRPMRPLLDGLNQLKASAISFHDNGFAPLTVQGPLQGGTVEIDGADSQPVSALIIASAFSKNPVTITVRNPGEKPWVDLTLAWLDKFAIPYKRKDYTQYFIEGNHAIKGFKYSVPGDWSSAAFPIIAALITDSEVIIKNVDLKEDQGDKKIVAILKSMGANIEVLESNRSIVVKRGNKLQGGVIDINDVIDALPLLAVLGCYVEGETHLINGEIARSKECDRIQSVAKELRKMGAEIVEKNDGLIIKPSLLIGAEVDSHNDHRMAMALAVAALGANGEVRVKNVDCISKTYRPFVFHFQTLGASIREEG